MFMGTFVILTICFLLMPTLVAYADMIPVSPALTLVPLIFIIIILVTLCGGTAILIRTFWKPNKDNNIDENK